MYKDILRSISDIEIFPVIAIVIFFLFFIGLLIWVFGMDKKLVNHMSQLPLTGDERKTTAIQFNGKTDPKDVQRFSNS